MTPVKPAQTYLTWPPEAVRHPALNNLPDALPLFREAMLWFRAKGCDIPQSLIDDPKGYRNVSTVVSDDCRVVGYRIPFPCIQHGKAA